MNINTWTQKCEYYNNQFQNPKNCPFTSNRKINNQELNQIVKDLDDLHTTLNGHTFAKQDKNAATARLLQVTENISRCIRKNANSNQNLPTEIVSKIQQKCQTINPNLSAGKSSLGIGRLIKNVFTPSPQSAASSSSSSSSTVSPKEAVRDRIKENKTILLDQLSRSNFASLSSQSREDQIAFIQKNLNKMIGDENLQGFKKMMPAGVTTAHGHLHLTAEEFIAAEILHLWQGNFKEQNAKIEELCTLYGQSHAQHYLDNISGDLEEKEALDSRLPADKADSADSKTLLKTAADEVRMRRAEQLRSNLMTLKPGVGTDQSMNIFANILKMNTGELNKTKIEDIYQTIKLLNLEKTEFFQIIPGFETFCKDKEARMVRDLMEEFNQYRTAPLDWDLAAEKSLQFFDNDRDDRSYHLAEARNLSPEQSPEQLLLFLISKGMTYADLRELRHEDDNNIKAIHSDPTHILARPLFTEKDIFRFLSMYLLRNAEK